MASTCPEPVAPSGTVLYPRVATGRLLCNRALRSNPGDRLA